MGGRLESDRRRRNHLGTDALTRASASGDTRPEGQTIVDKLAQFKIGAQSLLRREDTVPALAGAGIADN